MEWLKKLFRRKPVIGYQVFLTVDGKKRDMGLYRCPAELALEEAQMKYMLEFFKSGSAGAAIVNMEARPVRGDP
jgi:hypothetical protein